MPQPATSPFPGFDSPVIQSQHVFRAALDAFARPGRIVAVSGLEEVPAPLLPASAAVCLSLVDFETPLWLDDRMRASDEAVSYLRFHCGCPIVDDPANARFALISEPAKLPKLDCFPMGTDTNPEDAATLIVQVAGLSADSGIRLSGPGIELMHQFDAAGIDGAFWHERIRLRELFPRGIDLVFAEASRIAVVPRSTRVEV